MNRLYDTEKKTTEVYSFKINHCGMHEQELVNLPRVEIVFVNDRFSHANFPFTSKYTQVQWEVLEAISQKIREIEAEKKQAR